MDACATKFLESVTLRTLHAHNFTRSSTIATHVLTDLLARYFTLLATTSSEYAEHANRAVPTMWDAVDALDELGVSLEDLTDFYDTEGRDLGRYAIQTSRRAEELSELKAWLASDCQCQSNQDPITLVWGRVPTPPPLPVIEDDPLEESDSDNGEIRVYPPLHAEPMKPKIPPIETPATDLSGRPTPPLPLSPISIASPPPRKRKRADTAGRPEYVPSWLPPFPTNSPPPPPSPAKEAVSLSAQTNNPDKPLTPPPQLSTSATTSDYLTPVPYSMSSISSVPEWHLPRPPSPSHLISDRLQQPVHPTPQVTPSLLKAYHHILTNKPPANAPINPARHKVAMSILHGAHTHPRWTASDTLFSATIPNPPRVVAPVPSYPVPLTDPSLNALEAAARLEQEKEKPSLPVLPRTVIASESLTPVSSQPFSRLPDIARQVLAPSVLTRVTKMAPPQPLTRGSEKLLYGPGLPAPWNSNTSTQATIAAKNKVNKTEKQNGKEEEPKVETLPDSLLFATWEYEPKDFRVPVVSFPKKGRTTGPSWTPIISAGGGAHISDRRKSEKHERRG